MMTGAGDIGEIDDVADLERTDLGSIAAVDDDDSVEGDDIAPPVPEPVLDINTNDTDPTAGASDIGGRAAP
jgi:hypothetical protein